MNVIGHQRPAIAAGLGFRYDSLEALGKIFTISAVFKDRFALYAADDDMMQGKRDVRSIYIFIGFVFSVTSIYIRYLVSVSGFFQSPIVCCPDSPPCLP